MLGNLVALVVCIVAVQYESTRFCVTSRPFPSSGSCNRGTPIGFPKRRREETKIDLVPVRKFKQVKSSLSLSLHYRIPTLDSQMVAAASKGRVLLAYSGGLGQCLRFHYRNAVPSDLFSPAEIGWCAGGRRATDMIARGSHISWIAC